MKKRLYLDNNLITYKLKLVKRIIPMDDPIATFDSPDVFYNHPYDDTNLNQVKEFLKKKGNNSDFDARYIANSMLPQNHIDYFVTVDKKSLWNYKNGIEEKFGVKVRLPSELIEHFKYFDH